MPRAAWQSNPGAYRCHSYCSWCLFSFLCSWRPVPPLGVSSLHTPPGCVGLSPPGHTCTLTRCGVVQYVSVGLVGWWGRVVVRPRPPRRAGATSILWPQKGRALVAVTWHNHMRPCACGVAHALDKGSGAACASGLGRSSSRRGCSRAGAPPSAPLFDGQKVDQKSRTGPFLGLYMHPKPPPAPLLAAPVCREQQGAATCRTGSDMALHRRVFVKRKCGPEGGAGSPSTAVWRALRPIPLASGRPLPLSSA